MNSTPPVRLYMQMRRATPPWELAVRYGAAYASTLIAIAAAQLSIENEAVVPLVFVTLIGLPISLWLRRNKLQVGPFRIKRPLLNSAVVILALLMSVYSITSALPDLLAPDFSHRFWITYSAGQIVSLLMKVFLIFAACRCLAIINDKDAVLCAVPSFSVLLLMIPIHKGPEVVMYFLMWAVVCAVLFALDHHSELRQGISGYLPSLVPGQEATTSARSLATVMCFSLLCAGAISYTLSERSPDERTGAEGWIASLASRFTRFALDLPDISVNAGPERQIDFSSGPALPTNAPLWQVSAFVISDGRVIHPTYWRMFTLSRYDGTVWSQSAGPGWEVNEEDVMSVERWPPAPDYRYSPGIYRGRMSGFWRNGGGRIVMGPRFGPRFVPDGTPRAPRSDRDDRDDRGDRQPPAFTFDPSASQPAAPVPAAPAPAAPAPAAAVSARERDEADTTNFIGPLQTPRTVPFGNGRGRRQGYDIGLSRPGVDDFATNKDITGKTVLKSFGGPRRLVRQIVRAMVPNTGFLPVLPAARAVRLPDTHPKWIRTRSDNSIDIGVLRPGQSAQVLSEVPPDAPYGLRRGHIPEKRSEGLNSSIRLTPDERRTYLQLPAALPRRVRQWALRVANNGKADDSDYLRARRLSIAVQNAATYTLRPPNVPAGQDATDFFLFESRRGYCTFFAGALAVTCRAAGIPSRVVSGFTNPQWESSGTAVFREANSHAWTEVWVPGWGWVTMDATPPDDRGDNAPTWLDNWRDYTSSATEYVSWWVKTYPLRAVAIGIALIACFLFLIVRGRRRDLISRWLRGRLGRPSTVDDDLARRLIYSFYARAARGVARRYRRQARWETPFEWLSAAESSLIVEDNAPLQRLTDLYTQAKYSPHPMGHEEVEAARAACAQLSWQRRKVE